MNQESTSGLDIDQHPGSRTNRGHHPNFSRDKTLCVRHWPCPGDSEEPEPHNRLPNLSTNITQVLNPRLPVNWQSQNPPADSTYLSQPPEEQQNAKPVAVGFSLSEQIPHPLRTPTKLPPNLPQLYQMVKVQHPHLLMLCTTLSLPHNQAESYTLEYTPQSPHHYRAFDLNKALTNSRIITSNNIIALTNTVRDHSKLIIDNPIQFITQHPDTLTIKNYFAKTTILDTAESYKLVELCLHPLIDVINLEILSKQIYNTYKILHETFPTHMIDHLRKSFSDSLDNLCNYLEHKYSHRSSTTEHVPTLRQCLVNLTNMRLSRDQIMALNKGLSFIPTAPNMTKKELIKCIDHFALNVNSMYLKSLTPPNPPKRNSEPNFFRHTTVITATTFEIRSGPKPLEDAFHAMKIDISNLQHPSHNTKLNLTNVQLLSDVLLVLDDPFLFLLLGLWNVIAFKCLLMRLVGYPLFCICVSG